MDYIKEKNRALGQTLIKNFTKKNFECYYCDTKEEARDKAISLMEKGSVVTWGGSASINDIGLTDALRTGSYKIIDRAEAKSQEEKEEMYRKAFYADTYLMSANAVSQSGELVNIDGNGNRVAALCFGPKQVIVIAGLNKVLPDLDSAVKRARNVAAPINAQRFDISTPCKKLGHCADCTLDDCICADFVITRMSRPKNRVKIIFCGEDIGF